MLFISLTRRDAPGAAVRIGERHAPQVVVRAPQVTKPKTSRLKPPGNSRFMAAQFSSSHDLFPRVSSISCENHGIQGIPSRRRPPRPRRPGPTKGGARGDDDCVTAMRERKRRQATAGPAVGRLRRHRGRVSRPPAPAKLGAPELLPVPWPDVHYLGRVSWWPRSGPPLCPLRP